VSGGALQAKVDRFQDPGPVHRIAIITRRNPPWGASHGSALARGVAGDPTSSADRLWRARNITRAHAHHTGGLWWRRQRPGGGVMEALSGSSAYVALVTNCES
jgi:hypothetical protein